MTAGTEAEDAATAANANTGAADGESRLSSLGNDNIRTYNPERNQFELVGNLLSSEDTIKTLADMLLDPKLEPPFTVGVYGDWGTGKSYFLGSIKEEVDSRSVSDSGPITLMFEAWQHQADENILVSMLFCAYDALPDKTKKNEGFKDEFAILTMPLLSHFQKIKLGIPGFLGFEMSPAKSAEEFVKLNEEDRRKKFLEKQKQVMLKERFDEVIDMLLQQVSDDSQRRMIFFIDDLDRCLPEVVVDLLEKIKLFLWHRNCVYVIGIDQNQVRTAVNEYKDYKDESIAQRYLEKIINFPFRMPPVSKKSYRKFIEDKLKAYSSRDKAVDIFVTACDESQASLRLIIQLCNSLILNDYLVSAAMRTEDKPYKPQILAALTALQVLHEDVFNLVCGRLANRESRLQAFFQKVEDGAVDPLEGLISADDRLRLSKIPALRETAGEIDIDDNDDLSCYVEFLVSQSDILQYKNNYQEYLEWFEKGPAAQDEESPETIAAAIKLGNIKTGEAFIIDGYRWRLLGIEKDESRALLITEDIIGRAPLDISENWDTYKYSWTRCALNRELNSESWLKRHLPLLSKSGRLSESMAEDGQLGKIFLLSIAEAKRYLHSDADRISSRLGGSTGNWWWLRSPGDDRRLAAVVDPGGGVHAFGDVVNDRSAGVRPALWLNL